MTLQQKMNELLPFQMFRLLTTTLAFAIAGCASQAPAPPRYVAANRASEVSLNNSVAASERHFYFPKNGNHRNEKTRRLMP